MKAVVVCLAVCVAVASAADWAVIVAGSNTYGNYRHQSDACHAVNIALKNGIKPDNLINMVYDDIANSPSNPYKGKVFNKPTPKGTAGFDVYANCQKDYTGNTVTAANFINVITGNGEAMKGIGNGKVLKSGPNDNVFIYFTDHGGVGIVAFPVGPYLQVSQLQTALKTMTSKKMYSKVVFYMEACEAGSMFEGQVSTNTGIYVTTAANAHESSYGFYCPPQDAVDGKNIGSCLGDEYSVAFLEDSDTSAGLQSTLDTQYQNVKTRTKMSHVMQYGDQSYAKSSKVIDFLGDKSANVTVATRAVANSNDESGRVASRDIPMHLAYYEYLRQDHTDLVESHRKAQALIAQVEGRVKADNMFLALTKAVAPEDHVKLFNKPASYEAVCGECCEAANNAVFDFCGGYTDYSFKYARVIHNICLATGQTSQIVHTIKALCA